MFLIQIFLKTLSNERKAIFFYVLNASLLILIFNLISSTITILYPYLISTVLLVIYLIIKALETNRYFHKLSAAKTQADNFYAENSYEEMTFDVIQMIHQNNAEKLHFISAQLEERNQLFSQFIHNMKSSVSVIGLACEKQPEGAMADISLENKKLKMNLEQALNIIRLDEFSNDYVPEKVDLSDIVHYVINDKKRDYIYAGIYPKFPKIIPCFIS